MALNVDEAGDVRLEGFIDVLILGEEGKPIRIGANEGLKWSALLDGMRSRQGSCQTGKSRDSCKSELHGDSRSCTT